GLKGLQAVSAFLNITDSLFYLLDQPFKQRRCAAVLLQSEDPVQHFQLPPFLILPSAVKVSSFQEEFFEIDGKLVFLVGVVYLVQPLLQFLHLAPVWCTVGKRQDPLYGNVFEPENICNLSADRLHFLPRLFIYFAEDNQL